MARQDRRVLRDLAILCLAVCWFVFNLWLLFGPTRNDDDEMARSPERLSSYPAKAIGAMQPQSPREQRALSGVRPNRLHGDVGIRDDDGPPIWTPKPPPPIDLDMTYALRSGGGFNLQLSDSLPLDRDVPDSRDEECKSLDYDSDGLGPASVVIVFYNEPFSTLMRSVHSVLNRTPPRLLEQIVLVDDGSDLPWIKATANGGTGELESYVRVLNKSTNLTLVRLPVRKGIVGARMAGIRASTAEAFVLLDSHVEVNSGWLEPLLARIREMPSRIVMPQIDSINPETLEPTRGGIGCVLGFLWKLIEHALYPGAASPPGRQAKKQWEPITSPTMAGGLFAANKEFFFTIGGYDEQFAYWGTENLELSFKTWMCGGIVECVPCSRAYHIFRKGGMGYQSPTDAITKNKMRLLTIWMDQYADLAWRVMGKPNVRFGDYVEDVQNRQLRQCRPFSWYMHQVFPEAEVLDVPNDVPFLGRLENLAEHKCLDIFGNDVPGANVGLSRCHDGNSQQFMYFRRPQHVMPVSNDEVCLGEDIDAAAATGWCQSGRQLFKVVETSLDSGQYKLEHVSFKKCLSTAAAGGEDSGARTTKLTFLDCTVDDPHQVWLWERYSPPAIFVPPVRPSLRGVDGM